jgi:hypothetical protein
MQNDKLKFKDELRGKFIGLFFKRSKIGIADILASGILTLKGRV